MTLPWTSIRLFRIAVHVWLLGYLASALPYAEWLWDPGLAPLASPPGPFRYLTHAFGTWLPVWLSIPAVALVMALAVVELIRPGKRWTAFLIWMLYTSLMNLAWSAASGGQQLMANVLFWMIFLPAGPPASPSSGLRVDLEEISGTIAFWIIRLQLLLAYGVTAIQKLTGEFWIQGQASGIVVTDPGYGPAYLAAYPTVLAMISIGALVFQLGFPLAVWWRPTRKTWMWMGLLFHLGTGFSLAILDMAFAFLACYPIWFDEECARRIEARLFPWWRRKDPDRASQ